MITLLRAAERRHEHRRTYDAWHTFHPSTRERCPQGRFGALEDIDEGRLRPSASSLHRSPRAAEIITYVRDGNIAYECSGGKSSVIGAGEFQQRSVSRGARENQKNTSRVDAAHFFQICLRPLVTPAPRSRDGVIARGRPEGGDGPKRFSAAERRGVLCVVASRDGRRGSLRIEQDALMHSSILEPGQHVVHELEGDRIAWLHVVQGEVALGDVVLETGDGAGISADRAVSITARQMTEILLVNLSQSQRDEEMDSAFP